MTFYFYILRCKDGTLYSGSTKNIKNREQLHNCGQGSKYVWSRGGGKIIYFEKFKSLGKAMRREVEVKKWQRSKKMLLVKSKKSSIISTLLKKHKNARKKI